MRTDTDQDVRFAVRERYPIEAARQPEPLVPEERYSTSPSCLKVSIWIVLSVCIDCLVDCTATGCLEHHLSEIFLSFSRSSPSWFY